MPCELCQLSRHTAWHAEYEEPFRFVVLDCDSCDLPMAVLRDHRARPTDTEREVLHRALALIADAKFAHGWFFDDAMRQIPDHYHVHARPHPSWMPKRRNP